jgi:formylmethanofuran dehydrogenase subunit E
VFNKEYLQKIIEHAGFGKPYRENIKKLNTMITNAKSFLARDANKAKELRKALLTKLLVADTLLFSKVKVIEETLLRCSKIASKAGCCSCGEECASDCFNG